MSEDKSNPGNYPSAQIETIRPIESPLLDKMREDGIDPTKPLPIGDWREYQDKGSPATFKAENNLETKITIDPPIKNTEELSISKLPVEQQLLILKKYGDQLLSYLQLIKEYPETIISVGAWSVIMLARFTELDISPDAVKVLGMVMNGATAVSFTKDKSFGVQATAATGAAFGGLALTEGFNIMGVDPRTTNAVMGADDPILTPYAAVRNSPAGERYIKPVERKIAGAVKEIVRPIKEKVSWGNQKPRFQILEK